MVPGSNPPKRKSHRAKKGARTPTLTEFLAEAERLRETALAMLREQGHHGPTVIAWCRDGHREVIGLSLKLCPLSMGDVLKTLVRLRRVYPFASEGGTVVIGRVLDSAALGVTLGGGIPEALEEGER